MNLQLQFFTDSKESQGLPEGWTQNECIRNACKAVASVARTNGIEFWQYDFNQFMKDQTNLSAFQYYGITAPPAVLFYDADAGLSLAALKGNQITVANIQSVLQDLKRYSNTGIENGVSGYYTKDGSFVPLPQVVESAKKASGFVLGLGIFDLSGLFPTVPAWVWLIPAGLSAYQAASVSKKWQRTVWGSSTALFALQYFNAKKSTKNGKTEAK